MLKGAMYATVCRAAMEAVFFPYVIGGYPKK